MIDLGTLEERSYYTLRHMIEEEGTNLGHFDGGFVVKDGKAYVVLDMSVLPHEPIAPILVEIDQEYLHYLGWPQAEYFYEFAVIWPKL